MLPNLVPSTITTLFNTQMKRGRGSDLTYMVGRKYNFFSYAVENEYFSYIMEDRSYLATHLYYYSFRFEILLNCQVAQPLQLRKTGKK